VKFDEDGYLYVVDRLKVLVKHNGYQVQYKQTFFSTEDLLVASNLKHMLKVLES